MRHVSTDTNINWINIYFLRYIYIYIYIKDIQNWNKSSKTTGSCAWNMCYRNMSEINLIREESVVTHTWILFRGVSTGGGMMLISTIQFFINNWNCMWYKNDNSLDYTIEFFYRRGSLTVVTLPNFLPIKYL